MSHYLTADNTPAQATARVWCLTLRVQAEMAEQARGNTELLHLDDHDEPQALLARVRDVQQRASNPEVNATARTAAAEYSRCQSASDPELWQHASEAWDKLSRPYEVAYCCYRWAEAGLTAGNSPHSATGPLRRSHQIAAKLGAASIQRQAEDLARRSRISLQSESVSGLPTKSAVAANSLTRREQDVLRELAIGATNREIAKHLFLSPRTVEIHVSNLLRKLGVSTRTRAALSVSRLHRPSDEVIHPAFDAHLPSREGSVDIKQVRPGDHGSSSPVGS